MTSTSAPRLDPDQLRDLGAVAGDVELDAVARTSLPSPSSSGSRRRGRSRAGACAVSPAPGRAPPCTISNDVVAPVVVDAELGADRVEPGRLAATAADQPDRSRPGRLGQRAEQVGQRGVAVGVLARSSARSPARNSSLPDVGDQLLEHARALGVGDAVEVDLDGLHVGDVGGDRVRRGQLVLPVGPGLLDVGERRPGVAVLGWPRPGTATLAQVANDSLSHRSSHQRMVTRSPNHMCAISCRIVSARRS